MERYRVQSGDTLSAIAQRFDTTVLGLAKANHLRDPDVIRAGQVLRVPEKGGVKPKFKPLRRGMTGSRVEALQKGLVRVGAMSRAAVATGPGIFGPRTEAAVTRFQGNHGLPTTGVYDRATAEKLARALKRHQGGPGKTPGQGPGQGPGGGTPLYRQGDPRWGSRRLGSSSSLAAAGCAMTATAMAISKISGRPINPGELDQYLDSHRGYAGNALVWGTAAAARGLKAAKAGWSLSTINANLAAGKPVVIGVDFKPGSNGGVNGTDHWITLVGRTTQNGRTVYRFHDPLTGTVRSMAASGSGLVGVGNPYRSTGQLVVFSR